MLQATANTNYNCSYDFDNCFADTEVGETKNIIITELPTQPATELTETREFSNQASEH